MQTFKSVLAIISAVLSFVGMLLSAFLVKSFFVVILVLSLTNVIGITALPWFGPLTEISAIGTGLWMLVLGLFGIVLGWVGTLISVKYLES